MRIEPYMFVYTFEDGNENRHEITAPSKTKAREAAKRINLGGGPLRYVGHRLETREERSARHRRNDEQAEKAKRDAQLAPRIVRRRKAFGRNDRCPCGSGKKVKHCRCEGVGGAQAKPKGA